MHDNKQDQWGREIEVLQLLIHPISLVLLGFLTGYTEESFGHNIEYA